MRFFLSLAIGLLLTPVVAFAGQNSVNLLNSTGSAPAALSKDIRTPGSVCTNLSAKAWSSTGAMLVCEDAMAGRVWGFVAQDSRDSALAGYPDLPTAVIARDGAYPSRFVTARFAYVSGSTAYYQGTGQCENSAGIYSCTCNISLSVSTKVFNSGSASGTCGFGTSLARKATESLANLASAGRAW